jgi:hypothetical protein
MSSLEAAAEQLVMAAQQTFDASIIKQNGKMLAVLEDIRRHSQSSADQKQPSPADLKTSTETIVAAINASKTETLAAIEQLGRVQSLQWAMANASLGQFTCYKVANTSYGSHSQTMSVDIVKRLLGAFMRGMGAYVETHYLETAGYGRHVEDQSEKFLDALVEQIHVLTGQKPRVVKEGGKTAMYYK